MKLKVRKISRFLLRDATLGHAQTITESDDPEWVILTSQVTDTRQLRVFLRGLGELVEVLEPASLRQYFCNLSQHLACMYAQPPA